MVFFCEILQWNWKRKVNVARWWNFAKWTINQEDLTPKWPNININQLSFILMDIFSQWQILWNIELFDVDKYMTRTDKMIGFRLWENLSLTWNVWSFHNSKVVIWNNGKHILAQSSFLVMSLKCGQTFAKVQLFT